MIWQNKTIQLEIKRLILTEIVITDRKGFHNLNLLNMHIRSVERVCCKFTESALAPTSYFQQLTHCILQEKPGGIWAFFVSVCVRFIDISLVSLRVCT